jgi:hypothetical protein
LSTDQVISNLPSIRNRFHVTEKSISRFIPSVTSLEVIRHQDTDLRPFEIKDPPVYCEAPSQIDEDDSKSTFAYVATFYDSVEKNNSKHSDKGAHISIYA